MCILEQNNCALPLFKATTGHTIDCSAAIGKLCSRLVMQSKFV